MIKIKNFPLREIIFGLEDGIVSTLGVLIGIAVGTNNRLLVILSGLVVISVESLSMAAGTFLSNKSAIELHQAEDKENLFKRIFHRHSQNRPVKESLFMGVSYILGGTISLISFFFLPPQLGIISAVLLSFVFLFTLGFIKGKLAKINPIKSGLEMTLISATAAAIGYIVGKLAGDILHTVNNIS